MAKQTKNKDVLNNDFEKTFDISIVIPCYNQEQYIEACLDSISKQKFDNIEIILVDDGSTDSTKSKINQYKINHNNLEIVYVHQDNAGPGVARNNGISHAHGKYIAFIDSDDLLPAGAYNALFYTAEKYTADVVIGGYLRRVDNGPWNIAEYNKQYCKENDGKNCAGDYIVAIKNPSLWNRLYNRKFLIENNIQFLPEMHGEDVIFNLETVKFAKNIYTTESLVYCYTKRTAVGKSISTSWNLRNTSSHIRAIKTYTGYFDSIGNAYAELVFLNTNFTYFLDGLKTIKDEKLQNELFEQFKDILRVYQGNIKYQKFIGLLLGVDLDIAIEIPYKVYNSLLYKIKQNNNSITTRTILDSYDSKDRTLKEFQEGKIGFRYIIKYFKAWLKNKLKRKK